MKILPYKEFNQLSKLVSHAYCMRYPLHSVASIQMAVLYVIGF